MRKSQNIKLDTFKDKSTLVKLLAEEVLGIEVLTENIKF